MHIRTVTHIDSPIESVWNKLIQFSDYPNWNSFITQISGKLEVGKTLTVTINLSDKKPAEFKPQISYVNPGSEFRWVGKIFFEWLFKGEHYFRLESSGKGTHLFHGEQFSGLLAPLILYFIKNSTQAGFNRMNLNLKSSVIEENVSKQTSTQSESDLSTSMFSLNQFIIGPGHSENVEKKKEGNKFNCPFLSEEISSQNERVLETPQAMLPPSINQVRDDSSDPLEKGSTGLRKRS